MIVMADGGLYESRRDGAGWTKRVKLPAEINVNGTEIGAAFSPSGRTLLSLRATPGCPFPASSSVWHISGSEDWPAPCPAQD